MTMQIIVPVTITSDMITATNITASTNAVYDSTTTYTTGDLVVAENSDGNDHIYKWWPPDEETTNATCTDWPPADHYVTSRADMDYSLASNATGYLSYWLDMGATNQEAMFDGRTSAKTTFSTIDVTVAPGKICNSFAAVGLDATTVTVIVTDPIEGEVYNVTESITNSDEITTYYKWFFTAPDHREIVTMTDLPRYTNASIRILIENDQADVSVGEVILGNTLDIGDLLYGTKSSGTSYTKTTTDDAGDSITESLLSRQETDYDVRILTSRISTIKRALAKLMDLPAVFIGNPDILATIIYGTFSEFDLVVDGFYRSSCSITVTEGI